MDIRPLFIRNLAVCFLCATAETVWAQHFQHLTIEDGLSQDIVTAIAQDDQGFLWFGTEDGLNQYDGISFTIYKHRPDDSTSLSSNFVNALCDDHQGRLWVSTGDGVDLFDKRTKLFHRIAAPPLSGVSANELTEGADSSLWIACREGLFRHSNGVFTRADIDGHPSVHSVWGLLSEPGRLWFIDSTGLHCCSADRQHLLRLELPDTVEILKGLWLSGILRDSQKRLWVCTSHHGIFRFDSAMNSCRHYSADPLASSSLRDGAIRRGIEGPEGTLWFGTMSGLEKYDPRSDGFVHYVSGTVSSSGFVGDRVYSFCVDKTGILWVGTYRGGVNSYAPSRQKFSVSAPPAGSGAEDVYAITVAPGGNLLVGTDNGLFSVGRSLEAAWVPIPSFRNRAVLAADRMPNGEIWVGTVGSMDRVSGQGRGPSHIRMPVDDAVRVVFQDADGQLWVGTGTRGLYTCDPTTGKVSSWSPPGTTFAAGAWAMFQDRTGQIWIGTWEHEYSFRYDKKKGTAQRYGTGPLADVPLAWPAIRSFREDKAGTLWLGTWGGGIYHLDSLYRPVEHFTELDGLASDFVKSIEMDDKGRLWVGTERGLSCFDPLKSEFTTYTQHDGLLSSFFFSGASFKGTTGRLFFGGQKGLVSFYPDSIPRNNHPPPVAITSFRILDKPVRPAAWQSAGNEATLRYDQDFFSFEYIGLDFTAPEKNQYAYMLEGFDHQWVQAGTRRYASYTHLDPGTYRFRVRASNSDGVWNNAGASMTIIITPAFWMTWWFRSTVLAIVLLTASLLYQYRLRKLMEVERLRQRIARDLHDDIGTNLSAIVLASQMAGRESISPVLNEYVEDIRSVALETQEHMRDIVWMLNPMNDSLELLVYRMRDDAARLLRDIRHEFVAPSHEVALRIDLTLKRNIFLIYKEALHNIVKHSGATNVEISVHAGERMFDFSIEDNGRGFDTKKVQPGNGLENMKARASNMGGTLGIQSEPGKGTRVKLIAKIT